ncbi:hypothetical protein LguiB_032211 [Lonicera macranthoides]
MPDVHEDVLADMLSRLLVKSFLRFRIPLGFEYVILGFAYDDARDDYTVVRMVQFYGKDKDTLSSEVSVYSLKLDSWRRTRDFPYYLSYEIDSSVFVSGALHWVVG